MQKSRTCRKHEKGAAAIVVALSMMALVLIVGGVIDVSRAIYARKTLQQAADAGSLAAGRETLDPTATQANKEKQLAAAAQKLIDANLASSRDLVTAQPAKATYFPVVGTAADSVKITLAGSTPTAFAKLIGFESFDFTIESTTQFPQPGPIDLALVLDTTLSMAATPAGGVEAKLTTLKTAANALVEQVMASGSQNIKIGVVPYTSYVNVGLQSPVPSWILPIVRNEPMVCTKRSTTDCTPRVYYDCPIDGVMKVNGCATGGICSCESWVSNVYPWNGAVGPRSVLSPNNPDNRGVNKYTDAYLGTIKDLPATLSSTIPSYSGQNAIAVPVLPTQIRPLTSTKNDVNSTINSLKAAGDTHIPAGLIWGWNLLDPAVPYTEGRTKAELQAIGGRKVLLLMTDGINANSPRLWDGAVLPNGNLSITADWRDGTKTNALTSEICANIKADGIEIYTVLFDVKDPTIETILKNCAGAVPPDTERQYSFVANDRDGLLKAFRDITDQLRTLKLTK